MTQTLLVASQPPVVAIQTRAVAQQLPVVVLHSLQKVLVAIVHLKMEGLKKGCNWLIVPAKVVTQNKNIHWLVNCNRNIVKTNKCFELRIYFAKPLLYCLRPYFLFFLDKKNKKNQARPADASRTGQRIKRLKFSIQSYNQGTRLKSILFCRACVLKQP
ncbi:MAG: hypothetical protein ABIU77_05075 [Ferruginibacter sp.]